MCKHCEDIDFKNIEFICEVCGVGYTQECYYRLLDIDVLPQCCVLFNGNISEEESEDEENK